MTSVKRNQGAYLNMLDVFPGTHPHSSKRKNLYSDNLWNNLSYSSGEIRLMKDVKCILNSNTLETVRHKLHSRKMPKHTGLKLEIPFINNLKQKFSTYDPNYDMILPKKLENSVHITEGKEKHKNSSFSASSASSNGTLTSK